MKRLLKDHIWFTLILLTISSGCERNEFNPINWETASYEIEQKLVCFCRAPAGEFQKLRVSNDQIVEINGKQPTSFDLQALKTLKLLQEFVDGINPDSVAVYRVIYDETYGFPKEVYIDFDSGIADEEIGYVNRNFRLLE